MDRLYSISISSKKNYFVVFLYDDNIEYKTEIFWDKGLKSLFDEVSGNYNYYLEKAKANAYSDKVSRENAYNTEPIVEFDGDTLTVTRAATLWQYYASENNPKADELTAKISAAKEKIREKYPR